MASDPHLVLQGKLLAVLKADAVLSAAPLGGRIFDSVPPTPAMPYVSFGDGQEIADRADCIEGSEIFLQVDVWSENVGWPEAKGIAGAVRTAIEAAAAAIDLSPDHRLVDLTFENTQFIRDPDGITRHAAITLRALTEPVD